MTRKMIFALPLVIALGCGGMAQNSDDNGIETDDTTAKADAASYPLGYFWNNQVPDGAIETLILLDNGIYRLIWQGQDRVKASGTYAFTHTTSTKYLKLSDEQGNLVDRYAYVYKNYGDGMADLTLRKSGSTTTEVLNKWGNSGACFEASDCSRQGAVSECTEMTTWTCENGWNCIAECSGAQGWLQAVEGAVEQGEAFNNQIDSSALPGNSSKATYNTYSKRGDTTAYSYTFESKVAFIILGGDEDGNTYVAIYDASDNKLAEGSATESDELSWE